MEEHILIVKIKAPKSFGRKTIERLTLRLLNAGLADSQSGDPKWEDPDVDIAAKLKVVSVHI